MKTQTAVIVLTAVGCIPLCGAPLLLSQSAVAAPAATKELATAQIEKIRQQIDDPNSDAELTEKELGEYKDELTKLIDAKDQLTDAYYLRGLINGRLHFREAAVADLTKALQLNPKLGRAYWYRGVHTFGATPKDALSDFDAAIANGEASGWVFANRGAVNRRLKNYDAALKDFDTAVKLEPKLWPARMMRAQTYMFMNKFDLALKDANEVLDSPDVPPFIAAQVQAVKKIAIERLAPVDKPISGQNAAKVEEAMRPYIEQARKTLPDAKTRYSKGLPKGQTFFVTIKLKNPDGRTEQSFIRVESWKADVIEGKLASTVSLPGHKEGEKVVVDEKEVLDWTISKEDGTEDGNFVGKFLDTWKP